MASDLQNITGAENDTLTCNVVPLKFDGKWKQPLRKRR